MSTEQVGATAVADAPLPRDPSEAAALRESLMSNAEWMANWKDDPGKWSTLGYLRWVEGRNDPDRWGKPPEIVGDVNAQASDRAIQAAEEHAAAIDKHFDLTERQKFEILMKRPVYQSEKDTAVNELEKRTRDKAFMDRWRNGDRQAVTEIYLLNWMKAAPVSRSEEDTLSWDRAHPGPPRSE